MSSEPSHEKLMSRILAGEALAGVVGLGYVGLPLASELGRAGYRVIGVDTSAEKVAAIAAGDCYIPDVASELFERLVADGRLSASTHAADLAVCDAISICVPTPLRKTKDPDLSYVLESPQALAPHLKAGALVILESTTYPGTTEEAILPILEAGGRKVGKDFFLQSDIYLIYLHFSGSILWGFWRLLGQAL